MHGSADQPEATTTTVKKSPFAKVVDFFFPLSSSSDFLIYCTVVSNTHQQGEVNRDQCFILLSLSKALNPPVTAGDLLTGQKSNVAYQDAAKCECVKHCMTRKKKKKYCVCPSSHHYINVHGKKKTLIRPFAVLPNVCTSLTDQP